VRKAIASGRLTTEPDGTIDPDKADRAWVRNADPSKARGSSTLKPVPEAAVGAVRDTLSEAGSPLVGGMSYLHAKTAEKVLTVQLLREKLRREKGEVWNGIMRLSRVFPLRGACGTSGWAGPPEFRRSWQRSLEWIPIGSRRC
jgi:hypothetical protein